MNLENQELAHTFNLHRRSVRRLPSPAQPNRGRLPKPGRRNRSFQAAPLLESVAAEPAFIETSRFRPAIHPNPCAPNRGEAVRYLRLCFPDRLPGLLEAFARDPDEEMRYQLSEFLRDSDQEAAVGMKIGMLGNASPERQELLINEIAELGNLWHL